MKFRHELKYLMNSRQLYIIKNQLPDLLSPDPHTGPNGYYRIRSLYFDDYFDTFYSENENGTDPREKFRIRLYNGSTSKIRLERKRKEGGMTLKDSCPISEDLVHSILQGNIIPWDDNMDPLLKKFYILQQTQLLQPKVIVEYDRFPFIYPDGNVRVTLDLNIGSSTCVSEFLNKEICIRPIMPVGTHLLEVKFDEFLPDFIYRSIQKQNLQRTTFSKYYLCRKFEGLL